MSRWTSPVLVGVLQPLRHLAGVVARLLDGQRADALDEAVEVHPLDELHREVIDGALVRGVERLDDVRVRQAGDGLEFALELPDGVAVRGEVVPQHLERDDPAARAVPRLEDLADPALAEPVEDLVRPDHQLVPVAREQHLELIRRQPVDLDEVFAERHRVAVVAEQLCANLVELLLLEDARPVEDRQELVVRFDGHERIRLRHE